MGQFNPNAFSDHHLNSVGEFSSAFSKLADSASPDASLAANYLPGPFSESPPWSWEAAWIDLGGEG